MDTAFSWSVSAQPKVAGSLHLPSASAFSLTVSCCMLSFQVTTTGTGAAETTTARVAGGGMTVAGEEPSLFNLGIAVIVQAQMLEVSLG